MNARYVFPVQSFVALFLLLYLAGCAPGSTASPSTSPETSAPTSISVPSTLAPPTPAPLSPQNANAIIPLRRYGLGIPRDVAYASDGSLIAVASSIGVYRYLTETYEELQPIETSAYVISVAISPDSRLIAAGGVNGSLQLWDARDGTLVRALEGHTGQVDSLAFSPDGQLLASAAYRDDDNTGIPNSIVKIWRVEDGAPVSRAVQFWSSPVGVSALSFSPKGDLLISAAGMIFVMDSTGERLIDTLEPYNGNTALLMQRDAGLTGMAFSPDGALLATTAQDHTLQFWRTSDWEWLNQTITVPEENWVEELAYSPDGKLLIGGGYPVHFWDAKTRLQIEAPAISGDIAVSPDGTSLAVFTEDRLEIWRLSDFSVLHTWDGYTQGVHSLDISPDGQMLAAGTFDGPARLLQVKDGSLLRTLPDAQMTVHFSPDGQTLLDVQYRVQFWQVRDGILQDSYEWWSGTAEAAAYSPDGRLLAVGLERDGVEVMKAAEREVLFSLKWETKYYNPISALAFSPDSQLLASGDHEPTVRLWDMKNGQIVSALEGHTGDIEDVAFSPDGTILASAALDDTVRLWRVADGNLLHVLNHPGSVLGLAFSPDGRLLASACGDGYIRLWDMEGNLLATLSGHTSAVNSVLFLRDGMALASGSADGTIWLWGLAPAGP